MASADDEEFAGGVEFGTRIAAVRGQLRESSEHIELRDRRSRTAQPCRLRRYGRTHIHKKLPFDFQDALIGRKYLPLIFFQLGRSKPLGIHQRLFAFIVRRSQMQVWFRDFNVVAKDLIEANLQRADVGALALALLHRGDNLFAVLTEVAQLI